MQQLGLSDSHAYIDHVIVCLFQLPLILLHQVSLVCHKNEMVINFVNSYLL